MLPLTLLALAQPPEAPPPASPATAVLTGELVERPPLPVVDRGQVDFIAGVPMSIRYRQPLLDRLSVEIGGGLWLILPDFFAGLRADLGLFRGRKDYFAVRPGGGARLIVWPFSGDLLGPAGAFPGVYGDVDLVWQRCWSDGLSTEVGLKLGAMPVFGRDVATLPIVGLMFGVRF